MSDPASEPSSGSGLRKRRSSIDVAASTLKASTQAMRQQTVGCCKGHGKGYADGFLVRVADACTIATAGGVSLQWHRRYQSPGFCCLIFPIFLITTAAIVGHGPVQQFGTGMDIIEDFVRAHSRTHSPNMRASPLAHKNRIPARSFATCRTPSIATS